MAQANATPKMERVQEALINDGDFLKGLVETVLQAYLEQEMTTHLEAEPYERTLKRRGYRNGYKARQLKTRVGTLELLIPQDREGSFKTELFEKYQRSEKALVLSLMEMYLQGVSTRKVTEITEVLCGTSFSKSQVSALTKQLDEELSAWRERPLGHAYPYLIVDARYEYVRINKQVVSQGVLIVKGVRADGKREILAVEVADSETEASYQDVFRSLKARGLRGVQLVTSDDHKGLKAAIDKHFQGASWQRCQVHFIRNQLAKVARKDRKALAQDLKQIFNALDYDWAKQVTQDVITRWHKTHPQLAEAIDDSIEDALACYHFPSLHRRRIRTTNGLERLNQEIKRRTRVVRIFPNREACLRLVTALCVEQSEQWLSSRTYLDMSWLSDPANPQIKEVSLALAS